MTQIEQSHLTGVANRMAEACDVELAEHGDDAYGAGYVRGAQTAATVYEVMLDLLRPAQGPVSLLDFGCGTAGLLGHIRDRDIDGVDDIEYTGLDLSASALTLARTKYPDTTFLSTDVVADDSELASYDYVVMNGVFHWRGDLTVAEMTGYWTELLGIMFRHCRIGLAFNAMSRHVDWERDDLFHLGLDAAVAHITSELSRHVVMRADYGTYEYTTYVYREPFAS